MKIEIEENSGGFLLQIKPEDVKEVNKLFRLVNGNKKKSVKLDLSFYQDGSISAWINFDKNKVKSIGDFAP